MDEPPLTAEWRWEVHPARERLAAAVTASVVLAALAVFVYVWGMLEGWPAPVCAGVVVVALLVLVAALNRFYFPSRFTMDGEGITARYPLGRMRYRWSDVRRFVLDRYGGYLSTRARPSRLDGYRGMHLLFGADRDEVIRRIRQYLVAKDEPR